MQDQREAAPATHSITTLSSADCNAICYGTRPYCGSVSRALQGESLAGRVEARNQALRQRRCNHNLSSIPLGIGSVCTAVKRPP